MIVTILVIQIVPAFYIGSRSINILMLEEGNIQQAVLGGGTGQVDIAFHRYVWIILLMAVVTGVYTIVGGLKAVIFTDVVQSVAMIVAAVLVAWLTFSQLEIGGWSGMMALDRSSPGGEKMHLYLPSDHPDRPWTGMLTGLIILHLNYWGTNQFIVQRALAARTGKDARAGIITGMDPWNHGRLTMTGNDALAYPATVDQQRVQVLTAWPLSGRRRALEMVVTLVLAAAPGVAVLIGFNALSDALIGAWPGAAQSAAVSGPGQDGLSVAPAAFAVSALVYGFGKMALVGAPCAAALCALYVKYRSESDFSFADPET